MVWFLTFEICIYSLLASLSPHLKCGRLRKCSPRSFLVTQYHNVTVSLFIWEYHREENLEASCLSATGGLPQSNRNLDWMCHAVSGPCMTDFLALFIEIEPLFHCTVLHRFRDFSNFNSYLLQSLSFSGFVVYQGTFLSFMSFKSNNNLGSKYIYVYIYIFF